MTAGSGSAHPIPGRCRVAIVGGGLAGLELAVQLDALGVDEIIVFEAGPATDLTHVNVSQAPADALATWLAPDRDSYFRRNWESMTPPHYSGASGLRQRLGGRSLYWYGVILPIEDWALAAPSWPQRVVDDLCVSWRGGPSLYERVTQDLSAWAAEGRPEPRSTGPAGMTLGRHHLRRTPRATRQAAAGADRWLAYSPLDHWRDPETGTMTSAPRGVRVCAGTEVVSVVTEAGAARGILTTRLGVEQRVEADVVVLAAGTLESSRLGIQAIAETRGVDHGQLTGLADHIVQGFFVRVDGDTAARLRVALPTGSYYAACDGIRSNLFVDIADLDGGVLAEVRVTGEQAPSAASYVTCAGGRYPWSVRVYSAPGPTDLEMIVGQQTILGEVWQDLASIAGIEPVDLAFADYNNPARTNMFVLPETIRRTRAGVPATWVEPPRHRGPRRRQPAPRRRDRRQPGVRRDPCAVRGGAVDVSPARAANPSLTSIALARRLAWQLRDVLRHSKPATE